MLMAASNLPILVCPRGFQARLKFIFPQVIPQQYRSPAAFFLESPASLVRNSYLNRTQFPELLSVLSPLLLPHQRSFRHGHLVAFKRWFHPAPLAHISQTPDHHEFFTAD